jgi:hypothetical protein
MHQPCRRYSRPMNRTTNPGEPKVPCREPQANCSLSRSSRSSASFASKATCAQSSQDPHFAVFFRKGRSGSLDRSVHLRIYASGLTRANAIVSGWHRWIQLNYDLPKLQRLREKFPKWAPTWFPWQSTIEGRALVPKRALHRVPRRSSRMWSKIRARTPFWLARA